MVLVLVHARLTCSFSQRRPGCGLFPPIFTLSYIFRSKEYSVEMARNRKLKKGNQNAESYNQHIETKEKNEGQMKKYQGRREKF